MAFTGECDAGKKCSMAVGSQEEVDELLEVRSLSQMRREEGSE